LSKKKKKKKKTGHNSTTAGETLSRNHKTMKYRHTLIFFIKTQRVTTWEKYHLFAKLMLSQKKKKKKL